MNIGLFFGSFNPIHMGHMIIANIIAETSDLKEVWFVVSPRNPMKSSKSLLHEFDRLDMVEAAIADNFKLKATDVEFHMPRPSYTVDTFAYLTDKHPDKNFKLIIGEDNLVSFPKWKNQEVLLNDYGLYVYPRPIKGSQKYSEDLRDHPNIRIIDAPRIDISATMIRRFVRENRSIRYLVPDPVIDLIKLKKFYL